jgi:M3 family oligoendopeptidase
VQKCAALFSFGFIRGNIGNTEQTNFIYTPLFGSDINEGEAFSMKFSEMKYERPNIEAILALCEELAAKAAAADSDEAIIAAYYEQDKALSAYNTAAQLASIHYTQDTRDEFWSAERDFYDENGPAVSNACVNVSRAFLSNPHVNALERAFGHTCIPGMKNSVLSVDERVLDLRKEENALSSAYQRLYGGAMVELDGKQLTIPQLGPYCQSTDREMRRKAYSAGGSYFDAHRDEFDEIYTKMVRNRNEQARILGYNDYSELSYVRMNRIGYGPAEIKSFRDQVANDVVPLLTKVQEMRQKRTGITDPKFIDNDFAFPDGNPAPHGNYEERMAAAKKMYHELSPETGEFIDFMQENELFDVLSRPGKMSGGYMTMLSSYKAPFIFANWNNTAGDIDVLTHEAGHAFEGYLAARDESIPNDLSCPSMESAEIHSMSMEFLTAPWHELFFGEDTDKYELLHVESSLLFLAYGCEVDEFQHIMYQQPDLTPEERNQVWLGLEKKYRPWIDFDNLPFYGRGAGWQRQLHIYECPFYYIDYCLSTMAALQFFTLSVADHKDAWERYMRLVRRAGLASYTELCETAGLRVPFENGSIKSIAETVYNWIAEHQI